MPLRLFRGSTRARICPACERDLQPDATFCPSCYMVFRPEGVSALREHLQGARIPADVYLLRKLQSQDPDAGPVTVAAAPVAPADVPDVPPVAPAPGSGEAPPADAPAAASSADDADASAPLPSRPAPLPGAAPVTVKQAVESLLRFHAPLPPPAAGVEDVAAAFAWMLEHDPVIPNNLGVLQAIHDAVFSQPELRQLGYENHVALLASDDAALFGSAEAHHLLIMQLAAAYRRACGAYRLAGNDDRALNRALWDMASHASRLRIAAWVYSTRYGQPAELLSPRQRELPLQFGS